MAKKPQKKPKPKVNKYLYLYIVQGNYGYGWDDLTSSFTWKEAKEDIKSYRENERVPHRIIRRRELNPKYKGK